MSRIQSFNTRTTDLQMSDQLLVALRKTQRELYRVQEQMTTGKSINRPSDDPQSMSSLLWLKGQMRAREQTDRNLQQSLAVLDNVDAALGDVSDILLEAKDVAASQVGVGSDASTRAAQATVVDGQVQAMLLIANRQFNGLSLFGGNNSAAAGVNVFQEFLGGVRYVGGDAALGSDTGEAHPQPLNATGNYAFGALSSRVKSQVDLDVLATANTKLTELAGAQGVAPRLGSVRVNVDGTDVVVDLTDADTMGDVVTRINAALDSLDPGAALSVNDTGFTLTSAAGNITISDLEASETAADLGLELTAAAGASVDGVALEPRLTRMTPLAALGASVDWAGGLRITQGATTKVADFSTAETVEDLMNVIDALDLGLRLEVNAKGDGLDLISEVSGLQLSVGEEGGTTATDLGLRTFNGDTKLADFRDGLGVVNKEGVTDFAIELHDGTRFEVDLDGVTTVDGVIAAVEAAATTAGVAVGTDFTIGMAATGNGLALADNTAGGGEFRVVHVNGSLAAEHLGIMQNVGAAGTIAGADNAKVVVDSVFTRLMNLRDSLRGNDELGITLAGGNVERELESVAQTRAEIGIQSRRVQDAQSRSEYMSVMEESMLETLQGADFAELITRVTQLQTQLQASMQVGSTRLQQSLLDYLR